LPIPYGERPTDYRWNSDPLDLDGNYGGSEMDAGYFVLPYWMVRDACCRAGFGCTRTMSRDFVLTFVLGPLSPLHRQLAVLFS
jgi:hypothetical protein